MAAPARSPSQLISIVAIALAALAVGFATGTQWHRSRTFGAGPPGSSGRTPSSSGGEFATAAEQRANSKSTSGRSFDFDVTPDSQAPFTSASLLAEMDELDNDDDEVTGIQRMLSFGRRLQLKDIAPALGVAERTRGNRWIDAKKMLVLWRWADLDPEGVANYMRREESYDSTIVRQAAHNWADRDLDAALAWATTLPKERRDDAAKGVAMSLAGHGPKEAMAVVNQRLPGAMNDETWAPLLVSRWGRMAPEQTADALLTLADSSARTDALARLATLMAHRDSAAALAWAQTLPEGNGRANALAAVVVDGAADDPFEAARRWPKIPEEKRADAASSIVETWLARDGAAAREWADGLPDETSRGSAYHTIGRDYASHDAAAGAMWLDRIAPGAPRDEAVEGFARKVADHDAPAAAAWALTISAAGARDNAISDICLQWKQSDPDGVRAWLATTPDITPAVITKVFPPAKVK